MAAPNLVEPNSERDDAVSLLSAIVQYAAQLALETGASSVVADHLMDALRAIETGKRMDIAVCALEGPIASTETWDEPFRGKAERKSAGGAAQLDLSAIGYVEEEYFIAGEASGRAFKTSLLVRRPAEAKKFSGVVALETIHVLGLTPLWDICPTWARDKHAWIGVASQRAALERIKKHNPRRYEALHIEDLSEPGAEPSGFMAGGAQDRHSQEILAAIGAFLKSQAGALFEGASIRHLIMGGSSQTGAATLRFIAQSHQHARLRNGARIFDAYLPMLALPEEKLPPVDAAVLHVVTEGDLVFFASHDCAMAFRDDANDLYDRYRHVQIAGAPHTMSRGLEDAADVAPTLAGALLADERLSQFPTAEILDACAAMIVSWLADDEPPPCVARIERSGDAIARDASGNAKGGLRTPYLDVPTATHIVSAPSTRGDTRRSILGLQRGFAQAKLLALYGDRGNYLQRFNVGVDDLVTARWLSASNAARLKAEETAATTF